MRPLLSAKLEDLKKLRFPLLCSPKLDGIRALVYNGIVFSRTWKPIRQPEVQRLFGAYEYLDGELILGPPNGSLVYNKTLSMVMTTYKLNSQALSFYVFDHFRMEGEPFRNRYKHLEEHYPNCPQVEVVPHLLINNIDELLGYESDMVSLNYEGIMLRNPLGLYKYGRSTFTEGLLIKMKRFEDAEAIIVGFEELMRNNNEPVFDNLGYTKRSSKLENQIPADTLGAIVVSDLITGITFSIGSGFDDTERKFIWDNRDRFYKSIVRYKHIPYGVLDKPRQPTFLGFRDPIDVFKGE